MNASEFPIVTPFGLHFNRLTRGGWITLLLSPTPPFLGSVQTMKNYLHYLHYRPSPSLSPPNIRCLRLPSVPPAPDPPVCLI